MPVPDAVPDPAVRLVIFDFDGTLSDSGNWFLGIVDHLAAKYRFRAVEPHEVESLRDRSTRDVIRHLGIPAWKLPFIARYVRNMLALHTHEIRLFEGIDVLLGALRQAGMQIAVVTSNAELNARRILGERNAALVDIWECESSLYGKAPKFRRALQRAGVAAGNAIAIGDETRDIEAARRVGMRTGAVLWGYASEGALRRMGPDMVFACPDDIAAALVAQPSSRPT